MSNLEDKKQLIKELIRRLHAGAKPDEVKAQFAHILKEVKPSELAAIEEELIREGMHREEIQRLCEVHLAVFKESLESQRLEVEPGHPIYILLQEHGFVKKVIEDISDILSGVEQLEKLDVKVGEKIKGLLRYLKEYEKHKVREENTLFPSLEKHGITQPPAIMWAEHDEQRKEIKAVDRILNSGEADLSKESVTELVSHFKNMVDLIPNHFYKEEHILFPTALQLLSPEEWKEIKASMDELGYCDFTPEEAIGKRAEVTKKFEAEGDEIAFETGKLSKKELETMLNTLPVDITFVDSTDTVRYFSQSKERIFPRAKTVIGRKVQQCHPQKSIHIVNQILDDFRSGSRDVAEFWIEIQGRMIYIRYFPVRDEKGNYLGCVEVTQDITKIKKIEGEKRLL